MALPARTRTLLKLALSLVIAAVALEGVTRGWLALRGRPYSGWTSLRAMREMAGTMGALEERGRDSGRYALQPYTGWEEHGVGARLAQDRARFEGGLTQDTFDVLLLGSSVAAGFANGGAEEFLARLRVDPRLAGREPVLMPYGSAAFKQPQHLMRLGWLLAQGFEPDAVVCIDGFNEMALALANAKRGVPAAYPGWGQWGPLVGRPPLDAAGMESVHALEEARRDSARLLARVERYGLMNSAVLGSICRSRMAAARARWQRATSKLTDLLAERHGQRLGSLPADEDPAQVLGKSITLWQGSTRAMHDLCAARRVPLLHVLQPNPNVPDCKPLSAQERELVLTGETWMRAAVDGYPLMRAAMQELRTEGIASYDASLIFREVEETMWLDAGHLNGSGNQALAAAVAAALLASMDGE